MDANAIANGAARWVVNELNKEVPWVGCNKLPRKLDGTFYQGINIPALYMQAVERGVTEDLIFGGYRQLAEANMPVRQGQQSFATIFAGFTRTEKTETDAEEEQRIRRAYKPITVFLANQCVGPDLTPPFSEADKTDLMKRAGELAELAVTHLDTWQKSRPNKILEQDERVFITRLAQDLLIAYRTGRLSLAGEWLGSYPDLAKSFVGRIVQSGPKMMRPWGIATQLLRHFEPELDKSLLAAQAIKDARHFTAPAAKSEPASSIASVKAPNLNW